MPADPDQPGHQLSVGSWTHPIFETLSHTRAPCSHPLGGLLGHTNSSFSTKQSGVFETETKTEH